MPLDETHARVNVSVARSFPSGRRSRALAAGSNTGGPGGDLGTFDDEGLGRHEVVDPGAGNPFPARSSSGCPGVDDGQAAAGAASCSRTSSRRRSRVEAAVRMGCRSWHWRSGEAEAGRGTGLRSSLLSRAEAGEFGDEGLGRLIQGGSGCLRGLGALGLRDGGGGWDLLVGLGGAAFGRSTGVREGTASGGCGRERAGGRARRCTKPRQTNPGGDEASNPHLAEAGEAGNKLLRADGGDGIWSGWTRPGRITAHRRGSLLGALVG